MIETVEIAPPRPVAEEGHWLDGAAGQAFVAASRYNGLGRYEDALHAAERAGCEHDEPWAAFVLPELIEAAVRSGQPSRGREALDRLEERTRAFQSDWALGIEARSRALLGNAETAEELYQKAIRHLGRAGSDVGLARAHLLYGEWLR